MNLPSWLAIWMSVRRITSPQLAARLGVSVPAVALWRGGRGRPLDGAKEKIAQVTIEIEREQGVNAHPRGIPVSDWFRDPPTEEEARKLVPWAFPKEPAAADHEPSADPVGEP